MPHRQNILNDFIIILPNGETYSCGLYGHLELINELREDGVVIDETKTIKTTLSGQISFMGASCVGNPTQKQLDILFDWCMVNPEKRKSGYDEFFVMIGEYQDKI